MKNTFAFQTISTLSLLVCLTAVATWVPAAWLMRQQSEAHILTMQRHGLASTLALLDNSATTLKNLALLGAQRPTLQTLLKSPLATIELQSYLRTLQSGANLSIIVVCSKTTAIYTVDNLRLDCAKIPDGTETFYYYESQKVWLFAGQPVNETWRILVGYEVDSHFLDLIAQKNDLILELTKETQLLAQNSPLQTYQYYRKQSIPLVPLVSEKSISMEIILPIDDLLSTQKQLDNWLLGLLVLVVLSGILLGTILSERVNRPLAQLFRAAQTMQLGNLDHSVNVKTNISEIEQLVTAIDEARIALRYSLIALQRQKEWGEQVLSSISEGIITLDNRQFVTFFSHGAEKISGWQQTTALGRSVDEIFPTWVTNHRFSQQLPPQGQTQKIDVRLKNQMYTLAVNTSQMLFPEHNASQQVLVLRDVSESEGMHRLLVEFLANIAHEFRTPLSALTASIELLSEQIEILTLEELRELITALHLGTLNLHTLINNLLESANIETGQFRVNPQPTNLSDIIKSALNTLQPLFEKYKQNINFLSPPAKEIPLVIADDRRSIQALLNLLANAIKWNPFGGTITVKVSTEYRSSDTDSKFVQVSVIDDGKGLTSNGEHLYQRFYRNEQGVYRTHAGAGLGLSVAKAIVTAQNGEIGATNNEQGGAKFWINFRVAEINSVDLPIFESDSHNN